MPYRIAGVDVHKKMLAVVVADVDGRWRPPFRTPEGRDHAERLRSLAAWVVAQEVEEVVMESTAQYWRPVWEALEQHWRPQRRARAGAAPVGHGLQPVVKLHAVPGDLVLASHHGAPESLLGVGHKAQGELLRD